MLFKLWDPFFCLFEESAEAIDEPENQKTADAQPEQSNTNSSFKILGGFENAAIQKVSM